MKKKIIVGIVALIILLIVVKKSNVKVLKYKIKNNDEVYNIVEKFKKDYSYYEISWNKKTYPINIFNTKNKSRISKIYSYKNNTYSCILPIINGEVLSDIMCYKDSTIYNYQSIKGKDEKLDNYVETIKEYKNFNIKEEKEIKYNNIISFYNSLNKNISITTYKGIISNNKEVKIFDKDVYSNKISVYVNKMYLTADYNSNYEFDKFYIVDLTNNEISTIKVKNPISFDSYIQGIVDDKVYIFDPENEIQYEINPKSKKINITSNDYIKYYSNNKWTKVSVKQAKKELLFDYTSLNNIYNEYDKVYENEYYYYAIKNYNLYRINKNYTDSREFLIKLPVDEIEICNDYLYYTYEDGLYYYSNTTGLELVLTNKELEFNKYIKYYIY